MNASVRREAVVGHRLRERKIRDRKLVVSTVNATMVPLDVDNVPLHAVSNYYGSSWPTHRLNGTERCCSAPLTFILCLMKRTKRVCEVGSKEGRRACRPPSVNRC